MRQFYLIVAMLAALAISDLHAQQNWNYTLGGTVSALDRVKISGSTVVQAGATDQDIGVASVAGVSGDKIEVNSYDRVDIARYKADGAITAGADVYPGATGYVSATVQGTRIGIALNTTTTAGDIVKVVLHPTKNDRIIVTGTFNASSVDQAIFIAPPNASYTVISINVSFSVAGGASAAVRPRKITDTSAPGASAGTTVKELSTAADLTATANTTQALTLSTTATDLNIAAGNRICLDFSGTLTALAGGVIVIEMIAK